MMSEQFRVVCRPMGDVVHKYGVSQEPVNHQVRVSKDIPIPGGPELFIPDGRPGQRETGQLLHGIVNFICDPPGGLGLV